MNDKFTFIVCSHEEHIYTLSFLFVVTVKRQLDARILIQLGLSPAGRAIVFKTLKIFFRKKELR